MFHIRELQSDEEREKLIEGFARYVKVKLPMAYVRAGVAMGAFHQGELVGGYIVKAGASLRVLNMIPDAVRASDVFFTMIPEAHMVEVNGLWLDPELRSRLYSFALWTSIRKTLLASKASYLIIGYNAKNRGIARFYDTMMKRVIYRGPVPGTTSAHHADFVVGYAPMRVVKYYYFMNLRTTLKKLSPFSERTYVRAQSS